MNIENTADIKIQSQPPVQKSSAALFCLSNQALHKALKILSGVVDHSQVIQILGYIKCDLSKDRLSLIASNSEIEIHVSVPVIDNPSDELCTFTLPCRKLFDITRSLDSDVVLRIKHMQSWAEISVGKTRFKLASLPANSFPQLAQFTPQKRIQISQNDLLWLLNRTGFAMASQDVRFFLNGMLLGISNETLNAVATDGHRLSLNAISSAAFSHLAVDGNETSSDPLNFIVPRKTIHELCKHLQETDETVEISIGSQYLSIVSEDISINSNLIDGQYPKYQKLIPRKFNHKATVLVEDLRKSITKMSILANEKFHGAKFLFESNKLTISTHNVNHEEAFDEVSIDLSGEPVSVGFNLMYLIDILNAVKTESIHINIVDDKNSVSFEEVGSDKDSLFIVMPLSI